MSLKVYFTIIPLHLKVYFLYYKKEKTISVFIKELEDNNSLYLLTKSNERAKLTVRNAFVWDNNRYGYWNTIHMLFKDNKLLIPYIKY